MSSRSQGRLTTRIVVGGAAAGLLWLSSAGAAGAAAPDPLGTVAGTAASLVPAPPPSDPTQPLTKVVGTVEGAVESPAGKGSGSAAQPSAPERTRPGTSASSPGASSSAARVGTAPAEDGDTAVGADVTVRGLLGACVRLTRAGVPARTTVVVLDRNLLDELRAVGLPVERLLVPCPAGAVGPSRGSSGGTTSAAATTADPTGAGIGAPGLLAFTGAELAPTLLLAGGLLALGVAFLRKAHQLAVVR